MDELQKKLDELIALRDTLNELTSNFDLSKLQLVDTTSVYSDKVQIIVQQYQIELQEHNKILLHEMDDIKQLIKLIDARFEHKNNESIIKSINSLNLLINRINTDIVTTTTELSTEIALDNIRNLCNVKEYIWRFLEACLFNDTFAFTQEMLEVIFVNINARCDWRYPSLQLNPISEEWVNCMVASDPLYLVNLSAISITPLINNYPAQYQNRLRIYDIINQDFSILPQEQFGCISCCNFLNLYSLDIIKNYLITFFNLLRSGGNLICTIRLLNNPIISVEVDYFKYAAKLTIEKLFKDSGYELTLVIDLINSNQECMFLIVAQKPGTSTTSKMHQVLGEIIEK